MVVQIAAVLEDDAGRTVAALSAILRQDSWPEAANPQRSRPRVMVTERCTAVHGITNEMVDRYGQPPDLVLHQLRRMFEASSQQVAHNVEFDIGALASMCSVLHSPRLPIDRPFCTMRQSTDIVAATSASGGRKWPKLGEAYAYFQKRPLNNAHDALVDVYGCRSVYRGLVKHPDYVPRSA
jgi:DNA polymerase-3 subunit epsilon